MKIYNDFNNAYKIKQDEPDESCTMYKTDVKCIQNFRQKTSREDTGDLGKHERLTLKWILEM